MNGRRAASPPILRRGRSRRGRISGARRMAQDGGMRGPRCDGAADAWGALPRASYRRGGRQEAGAKGEASQLPLAFCLLTISGFVSGEASPDPSFRIPSAYDDRSSDVRCEASPGRLLPPVSSPPVRCPRQRCDSPAEIEPFMSTLRNLKISFLTLC